MYGITIEQIQLKNGKTIDLQDNSILVVTGPNNSGKSTFLSEVHRFFQRYGGTNFKSKVIDDLFIKSHGTSEDTFAFLAEEFGLGDDNKTLKLPFGGFVRSTLDKTWGTPAIPKGLTEVFVDRLDPSDRLGSGNPRTDSVEKAADNLFSDEAAEIRISEIFRRAFGSDMILHRERSGGVFHVGDRATLPPHKKRLTKEYRRKIEALPKVMSQGAGIRSFARIALQLLTSWKTITTIDEPELFLHPPQVRHLAKLITSGVSNPGQMITATHSEAFIKGLLDNDDSRCTVIRLQRHKDSFSCSITDSGDIKALWADPLFRTSNILSALFHDAAVLMEGETDVRFTQALMNARFGTQRLPDAEYFSCNGKSKIPHLAKALRSVNVPVIAVVDLDVLQNTSEFLGLIASLGGDPLSFEEDARLIKVVVEATKNRLTGRQVNAEIDQITAKMQPKEKVPEQVLASLRDLLRRSSPWLRVKQDGIRGVNDAAANKAAMRIVERSAELGLVINTEGELEGYCRTISNSNKPAWLNEVLLRDLNTDKDLQSAREYADILKGALENLTS